MFLLVYLSIFLTTFVKILRKVISSLMISISVSITKIAINYYSQISTGLRGVYLYCIKLAPFTKFGLFLFQRRNMKMS